MRSFVSLLLILIILAATFSCNFNKNQVSEESFDIPDSIGIIETSLLHQEAMEEVISNLASPVEVAAMLSDLGIAFQGNLLTPTENVKNLHTNFHKSLTLGAMGADLGYLNMYKKNNQALDYLSSINYLADELKVGQFFDFKTLRRLSENKHDLDSLMYQSVHSFNEMNSYLERTHRSNISALVITGLWLEGLYLATQVTKNQNNVAINESIGEQKIIMEDLFSILENYENDTSFEDLIKELNLLKEDFSEVEISYEAGEPDMIEDENGMLVVIQNEKSIIHITDDQLIKIIKKTEEIRNHFINL